MFTPSPISLLEFVISIANAIDLIDARIANHHKRVAYIANQLAREMRMSQKSQYEMVIAGLLHDIGMLPERERDSLLEYDDAGAGNAHCETGYQLLNKFRHFQDIANIIRHHHTEYRYRCGVAGITVPVESMMIYLADRIDILIDRGEPILDQVDRIVSTIVRDSDYRFDPKHVDAFEELATKENFWLDVVSPTLERILVNNCRNYSVELYNDDLLDFAELLAHIIDFRCSFTATHSSGVATVAAEIAKLIGFSEFECQMIRVAGYLHDIGKLAIPAGILEKEGKLTPAEYRTIKSHSYHTYRILEPLQGMGEIRTWAYMHHERLDGTGYPGRCSARTIPLGARIIAVADVFTALLESRPYRGMLDKGEVVQRLEDLALRSILDSKVVEVLLVNFDTIDRCRANAQEEARLVYMILRKSIRREANNTTDIGQEVNALCIPALS